MTACALTSDRDVGRSALSFGAERPDGKEEPMKRRGVATIAAAAALATGGLAGAGGRDDARLG